ncbi:unnamed protein product [Prorocentrum cordatum]|uniref:Uncharacterized protein n=1 Tax=Prorocentrum cordatum TaxID=2364126 RepID=A0ABN9VQU7_9DINO|nr:unnamed protein product [Polarella glacialis]
MLCTPGLGTENVGTMPNSSTTYQTQCLFICGKSCYPLGTIGHHILSCCAVAASLHPSGLLAAICKFVQRMVVVDSRVRLAQGSLFRLFKVAWWRCWSSTAFRETTLGSSCIQSGMVATLAFNGFL